MPCLYLLLGEVWVHEPWPPGPGVGLPGWLNPISSEPRWIGTQNWGEAERNPGN